MVQIVKTIVKWVSLPALLIGSMFSRSAASYELPLDLVICLGAIVVVLRAVRVKEYLWAAGFVSIAVVFSQIVLVDKIFLLLGFFCIVTLVTLLAAWSKRPLPAA